MPRAAVLGRPVGHSLSPALHSAAYIALGLTDWSYDAVECGESGLAGFLDGLGPDWAGLSLTKPLKRAVLPLADTASDLVREVGAANTVLLSDRGRHVENTDVGAIVTVLGSADVSDSVILGAGGTAAAAVAALRDLGASDVTVVVRNPARAAELLAAAERLEVNVGLAEWPTVPESATTVISTVPSDAGTALREHQWRPDSTVFDVLYHPWPTLLAAMAGAAGARVIGGRDLLLHQAARQVSLMTGRAAPLEAMRSALAEVRAGWL